jgi:hypothetical protein
MIASGISRGPEVKFILIAFAPKRRILPGKALLKGKI